MADQVNLLAVDTVCDQSTWLIENFSRSSIFLSSVIGTEKQGVGSAECAKKGKRQSENCGLQLHRGGLEFAV